MKTKIYIRWMALSLVVLLSSCNSFLDLDPVSDMTIETFWQSPADANNGVLAAYSCLSTALASGIWDWGEVRSDNYTYYYKNAPDQEELIKNAIMIDNGLIRWTSIYTAIYKANAAIKYIPGIKMNMDLKNDYLAEAYAIRALCYFYCVRVWGDVPLFLDPVESLEDGIYRERTDKNYILERIILQDLEKAYYNIDKTREEVGTKRTRINVATICAIMMDVYAWMHDYEMVATIFEERVALLNQANWRTLAAAGGANFANEWRKLFRETSAAERMPEVWFKIAYERFGNGNNRATSYFGSGSSKLEMSDRLVKRVYESKDQRPNAQWHTSDGGRTYRLRNKFWTDEEVNRLINSEAVDSDVDLVLYRYADVLLLYAEALNDLGRTEEAISYLNRTRVRAGNVGFAPDRFEDQDALLDAIIAERQKEFVGEGRRWFDLVRTNRWTQFTTLKDPDPQKALFPIHRDHLNQNPNLTQNYPAYPYP